MQKSLFLVTLFWNKNSSGPFCQKKTKNKKRAVDHLETMQLKSIPFQTVTTSDFCPPAQKSRPQNKSHNSNNQKSPNNKKTNFHFKKGRTYILIFVVLIKNELLHRYIRD